MYVMSVYKSFAEKKLKTFCHIVFFQKGGFLLLIILLLIIPQLYTHLIVAYHNYQRRPIIV